MDESDQMFTKAQARKGYEAYREHSGGVSPVTQAILPPWENTTVEIQTAWTCAAEAILFQ